MPERALLVTTFYKGGIEEKVSVPVMRALTLNHILVNKFIYINEDELIVGERGPAPKATPTYPEINLHSLEDLNVLDTRQKVSFKVDNETKRVYRDEIIPFWKGKNNRERIMRSMTPEWIDAYDAGIFTEFQEQRAPGHTVCGNKIYHKGMLDLVSEIRVAASRLDWNNDPQASEKNEELNAMEIAANAIILFAHKHAGQTGGIGKWLIFRPKKTGTA